MRFPGLACFILLVLGGYVNNVFCQASVSLSPVLPYKNSSLPVDHRVQDLIPRMTVEEKIKQLDMYRGWDISPMGESHEAFRYDDSMIAKVLGKFSVGSIHDFYPKYASINNKVQQYVMENSRLGIPVLFIEEGLHGYEGKGSTSFPIPLALAATWDTALLYTAGRTIAREMRANGTNMVLGPLLDIARDPRWGRMEETYGEDTYLVSEIGLAMVKGLQGGDISRADAVISEPKHFAVHGIPEAGSNTTPVNIGEREIRSTYLPTFEKAVKKGGAMGMMAAYHEIDGIPMVDNKWLLTDVLRNEWGFTGFVLSDLGAIRLSLENHQVAKSPADALAQTLNAGMNMQFYDFGHDVFLKAIDSSLKNKTISYAKLDSAVADVLRIKFKLGLFDNPYIDTTLWARVKNSKEHQELALLAAQKSICLLKNDHNVLPLTAAKKIAVIGPMATSNYLGGYSNKTDTAISLLTGLQQRAGKNIQIEYEPGIAAAGKVTALKNAVDLVKRSDVAIVAAGEDLLEVGEGKDRADLDLGETQLELLKAIQQTGKPVVVVLMNGRALCINWIAENTPAIVEAWFNGEKSGLALADVLLGNVNPGGKLPVTFPRSVGQIPFYYSHKPTSYHRYVDEKDTPLFPFGHGLSYTAFKYSALQLPAAIDTAGNFDIKLHVTNTGKMAGSEVVQLYIRDVVSSVTTPDKLLKAFKRISLNAGETKEVVLTLNAKEALALWNREMKYVIEPGQFNIMIGSSSEDIRLKGSIEVK